MSLSFTQSRFESLNSTKLTIVGLQLGQAGILQGVQCVDFCCSLYYTIHLHFLKDRKNEGKKPQTIYNPSSSGLSL